MITSISVLLGAAEKLETLPYIDGGDGIGGKVIVKLCPTHREFS